MLVVFPMQVDEFAMAVRDPRDRRALVVSLDRVHRVWVAGARMLDLERYHGVSGEWLIFLGLLPVRRLLLGRRVISGGLGPRVRCLVALILLSQGEEEEVKG